MRPASALEVKGATIWSTCPCPPGEREIDSKRRIPIVFASFWAADTGQPAGHETPGGCDELAEATESGPARGFAPGRLASRFWGNRSSPTSTPLLKPGARGRIPYPRSGCLSDPRQASPRIGPSGESVLTAGSGRGRRSRRCRYRSPTLAQGVASTARSEGGRRPGPGRRHRSPPRISDTARTGR